MKYTKKPYTKLHHVETHTHDDGSIRVEAHLMHQPPMPKGKDGKEAVGMPYASSHDYPNKTVTMTADDHEEAGEYVSQIHEAHQHEKGRGANAAKGPKVSRDPNEASHEEEEDGLGGEY